MHRHFWNGERMMKIITFVMGAILFAIPCGAVHAQFGQDDDPVREGDAEARETLMRIRIGMTVRAVGGPCGGLFATVPVPLEWPEQEVRIVDEEMTDHIRSITYRTTYDAAKQMLITIPRIRSGDSAEVLITFEVNRHSILPPTETEGFVIPDSSDLPRELHRYLGESPYIEIRHNEIREAAREVGGEDLSGWEQVEMIYDWVREHVEYTNQPLKGALAALRDGNGDCEELTSLFIAICRIRGIPARTVWVPGHCYPEFYLHDAEGEGHWFPCQAAGDRQFGGMEEARIILQKGDNFRVPEKRERQRYIAEFLRGNTRGGGGQPEVRFLRVHVPVPD